MPQTNANNIKIAELIANQAKRGFFGRRIGKSLTEQQKAILSTILPQYYAPPAQLKSIKSISDLFDKFPYKNSENIIEQLHLEIGFGAGEYLIQHARCEPKKAFIGVEPFLSSMVKMLYNFTSPATAPNNILLYDDDAKSILTTLPENSICGVDLFYPDPWNKKKHHKRRFVNQANLAQIVRILKNGGKFRFASDIIDYVNWTLEHCQENGKLIWQAKDLNSCLEPFPNWVTTRYEQKAFKEQRQPYYLEFIVQK